MIVNDLVNYKFSDAIVLNYTRASIDILNVFL